MGIIDMGGTKEIVGKAGTTLEGGIRGGMGVVAEGGTHTRHFRHHDILQARRAW